MYVPPGIPAMNGKQGIGKLADCKTVVLGASGVGKSALVVRFLTGRFIWDYDPTLECTYKHQTTIDDDSVAMEILDTAGQLEDSINREGQVRWGDSFVITYSVTDRLSFEEASSIKEYIDEVKKTKNISCVLVGNKCDLDHQRQVSTEEGEKLSQELACAFFETSACEGGEEINEAFCEVFRETRRRRAVGNRRRRSSAQQVRQAFNKMLNKIMDTSTTP